MLNNQFALKKRGCLLLSLVIVIASLMSISSCNNNKDTSGPGCLILKPNRINRNWVPDYTKPKSDSSNFIFWVKFATTYDRRKDDFKVDISGVNKDSIEIPGTSINDIMKDKHCIVELGATAIGDNYLKLSELNILKTDGTLNDFDFIVLTPKRLSEKEPFLVFECEVKRSNKTLAKVITNPCPPCQYCIPPCATRQLQ